MDKELIEDKLHEIKDQFNERKFISIKFYSILSNKMQPFYDGILLDDIVRQNI